MKAFSIKASRKTMMSYMGMSGGLFAMGVMLATAGIVNVSVIVFVLALAVLAMSVMHTRLRCDVENDVIYRDYVLLGHLMYFEKVQLKPTSEFHFYFENISVGGGVREVARFVVRDKRDIMMQNEITLAYATEVGVINVLYRIVEKMSDLYDRPVNEDGSLDDPKYIEEDVAPAQEAVK